MYVNIIIGLALVLALVSIIVLFSRWSMFRAFMTSLGSIDEEKVSAFIMLTLFMVGSTGILVIILTYLNIKAGAHQIADVPTGLLNLDTALVTGMAILCGSRVVGTFAQSITELKNKVTTGDIGGAVTEIKEIGAELLKSDETTKTPPAATTSAEYQSENPTV